MKGYYGETEMRLTGKAWEIQAKLRQFTACSDPALPLKEWLRRRSFIHLHDPLTNGKL